MTLALIESYSIQIFTSQLGTRNVNFVQFDDNGVDAFSILSGTISKSLCNGSESILLFFI